MRKLISIMLICFVLIGCEEDTRYFSDDTNNVYKIRVKSGAWRSVTESQICTLFEWALDNLSRCNRCKEVGFSKDMLFLTKEYWGWVCSDCLKQHKKELKAELNRANKVRNRKD